MAEKERPRFRERRLVVSDFGVGQVIEERCVALALGEKPPEGARPAKDDQPLHGWRVVAWGGAEDLWLGEEGE